MGIAAKTRELRSSPHEIGTHIGKNDLRALVFLFEKALDRPTAGNPPFVDQGDAVAYRLDVRNHVRAEKNRPPFRRKLEDQLTHLPDATRIFPGHEYLARNLEFTLDREPDNAAAAELLARARAQDPATGLVTTLAEEKRINAFLRLQEPQIIARLRASFPDLPAAPDARAVFLALRRLRNSW